MKSILTPSQRRYLESKGMTEQDLTPDQLAWYAKSSETRKAAARKGAATRRFNTQTGGDMTTKQTSTDEIYADLKLADRMTPGRTPWQTLRKRAENIAVSENLTDADRIQVFYNGKWQTVKDHRPGMVYIDANGGHWIVAAGMKVREISVENRNLSQAW